MKNIMIIIDGMGDESYEELNNQTPYEAACPINMEYMKCNGLYGYFNNCLAGFPVDSLTCILNLLGVNKEEIPRGRAYLEAISEEIKIADNDLVMRCNLVTIDKEGKLKYSHGGNLTNEEYQKLYQKIKASKNFEFYPMSYYKNLLVVKNHQLAIFKEYPPHENIGKDFKEMIPHDPLLRGFVLNSIKQLNEEEIKHALIPWGLSKKQALKSFTEIHNLKAAAVCHTEIVRGISMAMGMDTPKLKSATADIDTDLNEKTKMALELLKDNEFVLIHLNGADEAAHRGNIKEKVDFIKRIDEVLIKELLAKTTDCNILITSDHSTICRNGKHGGNLQPFILYHQDIKELKDLGVIQGNKAIELLKKTNITRM